MFFLVFGGFFCFACDSIYLAYINDFILWVYTKNFNPISEAMTHWKYCLACMQSGSTGWRWLSKVATIRGGSVGGVPDHA